MGVGTAVPLGLAPWFAWTSFFEAFCASDTPDDRGVAEVIGIVAEAGGLDYARRRGEAFAALAEAALAGLPESVAREALSSSIAYVMERHA